MQVIYLLFIICGVIMPGSPPPRSQLPSSPTGYSSPTRTRIPPNWLGVSRIPDLVLSSDEGESDSDDDEDPNQTIVQPSLYSTYHILLLLQVLLQQG